MSIEPWVRPVLTAGLLGGAADCVGAALLYNVYLRAYSAMYPPVLGSRPIPGFAAFFSTRAFVFAMGWAVLFAIVYAMQDPIRRRVKSFPGFAAVALAFGTVMWLVMRSVLVRGNLEEPALSIIGWLTYVLWVAPAIIWSISHSGTRLANVTARSARSAGSSSRPVAR